MDTTIYAVIFTSQRTATDPDGYAVAADAMEQLATAQPGFLGIESVHNGDGAGITVSYWRSLADVAAWKAVAEHRAAQQQGRDAWYEHYTTRVCAVLRDYTFDQVSGRTPDRHLGPAEQ